jgi:pimeloyl-ACP methyl ester carboxylesterase
MLPAMATLTRDGLDLHYEVTGSGPALLLPKFNYSRWNRYLDVGLLAGRFTVVTASPRGFAASSRLRVVELGCGTGHKLIPIAADLEHSSSSMYSTRACAYLP